MKTGTDDLLGARASEPDAGAHSTGILPSQDLEHLIRASKEIVASESFEPDQV